MGNRRLFWRIVDKVESLINQGEFTAGSRLPPERELAEMFDVSRPTMLLFVNRLVKTYRIKGSS